MGIADDFKEALDKAEADGSLDAWMQQMKREQDREEAGIEKFNSYQESLTDEEVEKLMYRLRDWEIKYHNMQYDRGIDTHSKILGIVWKVFEEYGTLMENDEMFFTVRHELRGFVMNLTYGQGSFFWITYNGERIY